MKAQDEDEKTEAVIGIRNSICNYFDPKKASRKNLCPIAQSQVVTFEKEGYTIVDFK